MASHQSYLLITGTWSVPGHGRLSSRCAYGYSTTKPECLAQQMHFMEMFQEDQVYSMINQLPNIAIPLQMHGNIQGIRPLLSTHAHLLSIRLNSKSKLTSASTQFNKSSSLPFTFQEKEIHSSQSFAFQRHFENKVSL